MSKRLKYDFNTKAYIEEEYEITPKADGERIREIKTELKNLDKTVDRQWEDYYIREGVNPVERIKIVITQKEALRIELQKLRGSD